MNVIKIGKEIKVIVGITVLSYIVVVIAFLGISFPSVYLEPSMYRPIEFTLLNILTVVSAIIVALIGGYLYIYIDKKIQQSQEEVLEIEENYK